MGKCVWCTFLCLRISLYMNVRRYGVWCTLHKLNFTETSRDVYVTMRIHIGYVPKPLACRAPMLYKPSGWFWAAARSNQNLIWQSVCYMCMAITFICVHGLQSCIPTKTTTFINLHPYTYSHLKHNIHTPIHIHTLPNIIHIHIQRKRQSFYPCPNPYLFPIHTSYLAMSIFLPTPPSPQ